jgi:hypothetical protein
MKRTIRIIALLALLSALGLGGLFVYRQRLRGAGPGESAIAPPPEAAPAPLELPAPELSEPEAPAAAPVAALVGLERTVKSKRSADLAWDDARRDMALFEDDAIRTFEKASATIAFGPDDLVEVDQNSLVIIKARRREGDEISLALLSGDLFDGLAAKPAPQRAQAIAEAVARRQLTIRRAPEAAPGQKTRVAVRVLPDRTTSVAAVAGSLRIATPAGGEVTLKEKMVTKIDEKGLMAKPRVLPGVPALSFPEDGATYAFQSKVPRVDMRWKPVERARGYRVVVATDSAFRKIFADEGVAGTALLVRNLQPGTYYWRVRAQDTDGFEGPYSGVRSVKAVYDDSPPRLAILAPPEMFVSPSSGIELKGETERNARVKVNGQKAQVRPDGSFTFPLVLKEGVNLVTVEAIDPAGNSEYGKRLITYKGARRSSAASVSGNR